MLLSTQSKAKVRQQAPFRRPLLICLSFAFGSDIAACMIHGSLWFAQGRHLHLHSTCCLTLFAYFQEFASERELCWHLCMALGLADQHKRLAEALAQANINETQHPTECRAQTQVWCASSPYKLVSPCRVPAIGLHSLAHACCSAVTSESLHPNRPCTCERLCLEVLLDNGLDSDKQHAPAAMLPLNCLQAPWAKADFMDALQDGRHLLSPSAVPDCYHKSRLAA